jgi:hypothetical protein
MKKSIILLGIIIVAITSVLTVRAANSINNFSPVESGPGNCGYGYVYILMAGPAGYTGCYRPDGTKFRDVQVCTTLYGTGCNEDICNPPCTVEYPN